MSVIYEVLPDKSQAVCLLTATSTGIRFGTIHSIHANEQLCPVLTNPEWENNRTNVYTYEQAPDGRVHILYYLADGKLEQQVAPQSGWIKPGEPMPATPHLKSVRRNRINQSRPTKTTGQLVRVFDTIWDDSGSYSVWTDERNRTVLKDSKLSNTRTVALEKPLETVMTTSYACVLTKSGITVMDNRSGKIQNHKLVAKNIRPISNADFLCTNVVEGKHTFHVVNASTKSIKKIVEDTKPSPWWSLAVSPSGKHYVVGTQNICLHFGNNTMRHLRFPALQTCIADTGNIDLLTPDWDELTSKLLSK